MSRVSCFRSSPLSLQGQVPSVPRRHPALFGGEGRLAQCAREADAVNEMPPCKINENVADRRRVALPPRRDERAASHAAELPEKAKALAQSREITRAARARDRRDDRCGVLGACEVTPTQPVRISRPSVARGEPEG